MGRRLSDFHGDCLIVEGAFALHWKSLPGEPQQIQFARNNASNETILRSVAAIEEYRGTTVQDDQTGVEADIARLDNKLNVLLGMVSELIKQQRDIPEAVPVLLSVQAIEWWSENTPTLDEFIQLELYVNPSYPSPLLLTGKVEMVENLEEGIFHVVVNFVGINEAVIDQFERFIFRHHRRGVALSRRHHKQQTTN
ncbi:MAG: PilZ domain-containing protein [Gammaproteobacteria bacterium]|nr:PilZ domain-containing protein [Gammaproteobacteria bacterium]